MTHDVAGTEREECSSPGLKTLAGAGLVTMNPYRGATAILAAAQAADSATAGQLLAAHIASSAARRFPGAGDTHEP
jgi:DNA-binding GntR family transcriptional regulator